jgi:flagellar motility protein MotE (MotC chaperone)
MRNNRGGILIIGAIVLGLIVFFVMMLAIFSYKAGYLRIELGMKKEVTNNEPQYDKNAVLALQKKEEDLTKKEALLKQKEEEVNALLAQVAISKKNIDVGQTKITEEQVKMAKHVEDIQSYFKQFTEEEEENIKRLAKLYESMKPDRVAIICDELDTQTVAALLVRIKARTSAKILAAIAGRNAVRAAQISKIIEGQNKKDAFARAAQ